MVPASRDQTSRKVPQVASPLPVEVADAGQQHGEGPIWATISREHQHHQDHGVGECRR